MQTPRDRKQPPSDSLSPPEHTEALASAQRKGGASETTARGEYGRASGFDPFDIGY